MSQAEYKKRLKALMNKPENQVCADCPERQPRWASLIVPPPGCPPGTRPIGAFVCLECSGSHRRLGVHISFVRSINLDSWKEKEVLGMENGGNKKVNQIFEANIGGTIKPNTMADGRTRERFIRDKYERRKFFSPQALSKYYAGEESSSEEESSEEDEPVRSAVAPKKKLEKIRSPSDAALKRAESRKARMASIRNTANALKTDRQDTKPITAAPAPATPAPAPVVMDLLDFGTPMKNPGPPPDPPSLSQSPNLDLFKDMDNLNKGAQNPNAVSDHAAQIASSLSNVETKQGGEINLNHGQRKKFNNDEIMSMFNQAPQQQGFAAFNNISMNSMNPSNNFNAMGMNNNTAAMGMMGGMQMPQHANMNPNSTMMFPMTHPMQQQQNQQAQMMMMMQNNMMTMQQQQQQQQPNFFNNNTMMNNQASSQQHSIMGGTPAANTMQQNIHMMNGLNLGGNNNNNTSMFGNQQLNGSLRNDKN